jgi:hypothetical protein
MTFQIDPAEGTEAAAALADDQFQLLLQIVMWELAMRTGPEQFEEHLKEVAAIRPQIEANIVASRRARDSRCFVASVLSDIERLPSVEAAAPDITTGLYL